jgi:hypothetical protein
MKPEHIGEQMSDELSQDKEMTKLEKYLRRNGSPNLIVDLRKLTADELRKRIQDQAIYKQDTITLKQNDEVLNGLKDQVREQTRTYNDNIRMNDKISRFISLLLKDLG